MWHIILSLDSWHILQLCQVPTSSSYISSFSRYFSLRHILLINIFIHLWNHFKQLFILTYFHKRILTKVRFLLFRSLRDIDRRYLYCRLLR